MQRKVAMRKLIPNITLSLALIICGSAHQSIATLPAAQANSPGETIKEWMSLKSVFVPQLSPDGRFVAYQLQEANWDENALEAEIWITSVASGERYQLTKGKGSSTTPRWSPDGSRLAFRSNRDGRQQIYVVAPPSLEPIQLTKVETGVNTFEWSPDGRRIAFTASETGTAAANEETAEFRVLGASQTSTNCLWMIDVPAGDAQSNRQPERLTAGDKFSVNGFSWSPDSSRVAFDAARSIVSDAFMTSDIFVLKLVDKSVRKIVDARGPDTNPVWSPDGKEIAYSTSVRNDRDEVFYYTNAFVAVAPAEGGASRVLTEQFDETPALLAWSPEGIYFTALQKTYQHLFRLNPSTKAIARLSEPYNSVFSQFSFSKDFRQVSFIGADAAHYPEIYVSTLENSFAPKRLTGMQDQLKNRKLATLEVINWKSKDGTPIEGILTKPPDFDSSKKYPLLVVIHTGPSLVDQATIDRDLPYPGQLYAEKGALVLRVNYRGSIGYGQRFRSLLVRNLGLPEYEDVITGVDYLIAQGIVDRERVGAMGYSHGGYIAAFISAYSDRFRAVSAGALVSDWTTYYTNSDAPEWTLQFLKATPWDDPDIYRKTAPLTYIKQARTPTLIQHGEFDRRAPIAGAYELYRALKDRGVPVKMIVYKGAGHVPAGLRQIHALMLHNYEWFSQWIWNENQGGK
jgi:dipeptidyl aminopeptidase/acylaminoacyl peptidase